RREAPPFLHAGQVTRGSASANRFSSASLTARRKTMRRQRVAILASAAAIVAASAAPALASERNRLNVALPVASLAQVDYVGDVAPTVTLVPVETRAPVVFDPFARMDRIAAIMEARHRAMMRQVAALQDLAARAEAAPGLTVAGALPAGARYTMVSSTTDA